MRWHAQVLHVARKDLLLSRWLLLAYVAVVAGVTAAAAEWGVFAEVEPPLPVLGLILLGAVLLAFLVQADSPARSNSYWVTLPLHPSAVFAAKLAVGAVVLIGIPLLGQLVGLRVHDVAPGDLPGLLGKSALSYGSWLGVAAVIAALTSDLRGFFVALTLTVLVWQMGGQLVLSAVEPAAASGGSRWPVMEAGILLLLAHQYLTRNVRRGAFMGVALAVAVLALLAVPARSTAPTVRPARAIPQQLRPTSIEVGAVTLKTGAQSVFTLRVVGASSFHQYLLVSPTVRLRMADGSSAVVRIRERLISLNSPVPHLQSLRTLGTRPRIGSFAAQLSIDPSPAQRQALAAGQARLSLQGHLEVRELRHGAELPLRPGAVAASGGRRVRITSVENLGQGPAVEVRTSSVDSSADEWADASAYGPDAPEYLLVNRTRREALQMREGGSSGSDLALVLPGPRARSSTAELVQDDQGPDEGSRVGPEWLNGARLLLVNWVPVGSDPISVQDGGRGYKEWAAENAARGSGR